MTVVRVQNPLEFLDRYLKEIAQLIKENESVEIQSRSFSNIDYLVTNFFQNYSVRSKYLGKRFTDYYFLDLSSSNLVINEVDEFFLKLFSTQTAIEFVNLSSVLNFLEEQDKFIVLYSSNSEDENLSRFLLSYSFILKKRIIFIFASTHGLNLIDKNIEVELSDAFLNYFIESKLVEMDLQGLDSAKVATRVGGDLGVVYKAIYDVLNEKPNIEESVFENTHIEEVEVRDAQFEQSEQVVMENIKIIKLPEIEKNTEDKLIVNEQKVFPTHSVQDEQITSTLTSTTDVPLTGREQGIYNVLKDKQFISRLELAQIVWGNEEGTKASNDAIDQVISRLRRKFVKAGYPKDYIFSKKGEGVGINEVS